MTKTAFLTICLLFSVFLLMALPRPLRADSLRFLTDLEYTNSNSTRKDKATGEKTDIDYSLFSQLYSLDFSKELTTTLILNGGGMFDQDSTDTETDGIKTESRDRNIRPYAELLLTTPLLQAGTGFRRTELKETESDMQTSRRYSDEYTGRVDWKPVELPSVSLNYTRTLIHDEPETTDSESDVLELRSKYQYKDLIFDYNHTNTDIIQQVSDFETKSTTDNGSVRYMHLFLDRKVSVNAGGRYKREKVEFAGLGDRVVDTSDTGITFANLNDPPPATSNSVDDFDDSLTDINLLSSTPQQLSFGLNFGSRTEVDTVYVVAKPESPTDNQASPEDISRIAHLFVWSVYESDDQENWHKLTLVRPVSFDSIENRFEISFTPANTRYLKIVTTPLLQSVLPNKSLFLQDLEPKRTLPPETSEFSTTTWNSDLAVNWKMTDKTSTGYDLHYRQEESKPFDDKRTWLNYGANLRHIFNTTFAGNMRLTRSDITEKDGPDSTNHTFSASFSGYYLDTFNQTFTYSFSHDDDDEDGTSSVNSLLLRNNVDLYDGWSMNLDNGYSWQYPAEGGETTNTFTRVGSTITPNRWVKVTVDYELSFNTRTDQADVREQTGSMVISWVPYPSLSMSADLSFTDEKGETNDSYTRQLYGFNWSPFRDGTLQFSLLVGDSQDTDGEKTSSVTPSLKWQITRNALLRFEYSVGEYEDEREINKFENIIVSLRIYY